MNLRQYRQYLSDPDHYDHPITHIEFIETHISLVVLTGKWVYKVKKPVKFGGVLDFTLMKTRQQCCINEVELNQELAPDIYIGVYELQPSGFNDELTWEYDFCVKMKELPQETIMQHILEQGDEITTPIIYKMADILKSFYSQTTTYRDIDYLSNLREKITENFSTLAELDHLDPDYKKDVLKFLDTHKELFQRRIRSGRIKDGHGDLQPRNIFIHNNIHIVDRIEFNQNLRIVDVAEDLAFLAMELDHYSQSDKSDQLVSRAAYLMNDDELIEVIDFFKSYRALVKMKVNLFRSQEVEEEEEKQKLIEEAEIYRDLAYQYEVIP